MADGADDLDAVAMELLALTPTEFTAARTARARAADTALAARITALRKPTISAWAIDLLARGDLLGEALELAGSLRDAQDDFDAAELSRLGRQRRQLITALTEQAAALAEDRGVKVSAAARAEIEATVNAAMIDPPSTAAVRSGRLVRPIEANGLAGEDVADWVAGSSPSSPERTARDDLAERRSRKAAEKAARDAEREAARTEREHARLGVEVSDARERVERLTEQVESLRRDLSRAESDQSAETARLRDLTRAWTDAGTAATAAADEANRTRDALDSTAAHPEKAAPS